MNKKKNNDILIRDIPIEVIEILDRKSVALGFNSRQEYLKTIILDHVSLENPELLKVQETMMRSVVKQEVSAVKVTLEELVKTLKY